MNDRETPDVPGLPWDDRGDEIVGPGIGTGFVKWKESGEYLRGIIRHRWQSGNMRGPALTLELTAEPMVAVVDSTGGGDPIPLIVGKGDVVNLTLSYDLEQKLGRALAGEEIGVLYSHDVETKGGHMRAFRVVRFAQEELPF